jgi:hypothetical protein
MTGFRIMPRNSIAIADLKNPSMEGVAKQYDAGNKGFLTTEEAFRLFADKNDKTEPKSIQDVIKFLGGAQHQMTVRHMEMYEVLGSPWFASNWKGDFNISGVGAGNVRTGREVTPNYANPAKPPVDAFVFLVDANLMDGKVLEKDVVSATVVVGPKGFKPDAGSTLGEGVEVPLSLATQDAYTSFNRGGGASQVPERKYLAAAVDTKDIKDLAGTSGGVSFYVRLQMDDGRTLYLNKDGVSGRNFEVDAKDLAPAGTP